MAAVESDVIISLVTMWADLYVCMYRDAQGSVEGAEGTHERYGCWEEERVKLMYS